MRELRPDVSVVAAYGQILPEAILDLPVHGSVNLHASLLPELRGAAPINWAIIRGHTVSGVTVMRMAPELDAGPILHQVRVPVGETTTAGELYRELAEAGANALLEVLGRFERGEAAETEQDHARATWAPKLDRAAARLDWSLPAPEVARWIRGCDPWPAAWSTMADEPLHVFAPEVVTGAALPQRTADTRPGTVLSARPDSGLVVATGEGAVRIGEVKPAGKRRMTAADWLRGRRDLERACFG